MFGWIRKLFKKKKVIKKSDYSKYKISLNMKTLCFYERMTEKTAFRISADDVLQIMYSAMVCNNDFKVSYDAFLILLENEPRFLRWLLSKFDELAKSMEMSKDAEDAVKDVNDDNEYPMVRDIVAQMIVAYHIDPYYVMNDMEIWQLSYFVKAYNKVRQDELEEARLWTYISILPQIDGKKVKSPEALIHFPWEKSVKERAKEDLDKMTKSVIATLNFYNKKKDNKEEEKKEDNG